MRMLGSAARLVFLFVLLTSVASGQQPAPPKSGDLLLHVELSARTLPPGAPLFAGVQLRNVSDHDIGLNVMDALLALRYPHAGFQMEVTTLDGKPVPMSKWGRQTARQPARRAVVTLLPGEEQMAVLDVAGAYDLSQPGNYVLRVSSEGARSIPIVFSLVAGAKLDARAAAIPDPQREAAAAEYTKMTANAPLQATSLKRNAITKLDGPLNVDVTLTNRSGQPVRFGYRNWVRLEVQYPDGRTVDVFGRQGDRDWNQLLGLSTIAAQHSVVFNTTVQDRFTFPEAGNYVLRFWFPRAREPYTLPVTIN